MTRTRRRLMERIARKKRARQSTAADYRLLVLATVRQLRRECRA